MMKKQLFFACICLGLAAFPSFNYKPEALVYPIPAAFLPDFSEKTLDPTIETLLPLDNEGTVLHVPEDAFVDIFGNVVEDPVTILYKEYNNSADMAFSKIPMTYQGNNFNSSGMFEIQGKCKGKPIRVAPGKSLTIDYKIAQKNPGTDFYRLNEGSGQWTLVADIPEMTEKVVAVQDIAINVRGNRAVNNNINVQNNNWNVPRNQINWDEDQNLNVRRGNRGGGINQNKVMEDDGNRTNATLLAENADAGHTYPDIVKGLNVESFGVYNCDQIYRVPNRVDVTASFKDQNGKALNDLHVLSLIDLEYNGAFSFSPNRFTCNAKGNNVILLFSTSDKLYLLDKGEFAKMKIEKSGDYTFTVKEVSNTIRNTADLAKHLGLKV